MYFSKKQSPNNTFSVVNSNMPNNNPILEESLECNGTKDKLCVMDPDDEI
jgi:hypothetical protein